MRNRVVFREILHSLHKFYKTAGRDGRDKSHLCRGVSEKGCTPKVEVSMTVARVRSWHGCNTLETKWHQAKGVKKKAKKRKRANRKLFREVAFSSDQCQSLGFNQIQNHSVTSMNNFADTFISVRIFILCRSSRNTVTKIHYDENPSIECALD